MLCWILNSDEDLTIDVFDEKNIYDVYQHVRESLLPLIEQNDLVVLDFTGVNVVCSSFADECIAKLLLHMRLTELKSRTTFKGLSPIASECVLTALRRRHLATA